MKSKYYPRSFVFWFSFMFIFLVILISPLAFYYTWFISNISIILKIIASLVYLYGLWYIISSLITFIKESILTIDEKNHIISIGKIHDKDFPKVNVLCNDIEDYWIGFINLAPTVTFTLKDGKKKKLFVAHFTKKQIRKILEEIQKRGGLENKKIEIKTTLKNMEFYK